MTSRPYLASAIIVGLLALTAPRANAQMIACNNSWTATDCRNAWKAMYPNSASVDACWANTDCNNGWCNYFTANRCGTSGPNTPSAQCCIDDANTKCQNGNAVSCNDMCANGYLNCDNNFSNGCETNGNSDVNHCGSCGVKCPTYAHGTSTCNSTLCGVTCVSGYTKCAGNPCDTFTDGDPANCGGCNNVCPVGANALTAICSTRTCKVGSCVAGHGDCDGNPTNGCEANTNTEILNCGTCGHICPANAANHQVATCGSGTCGLACAPNYADCDGNPANGCEVQLNGNDIHHCGACNTVCTASGSNQPVCNAGTCGTTTCAAGTQTCATGGPCGTNTNTSVTNCGGCNSVCSSAGITPACAGGICNGTCKPGLADCNNDKQSDGCETNINTDVANCGGCNMPCTPPNAVAACAAGACTFTQCAAGFNDCDANTANGCETHGPCPVAGPDMAMMASMPDMAGGTTGPDASASAPPDMAGGPGAAKSGCDYSGSGNVSFSSLLLVLGCLALLLRQRKA